MSSYIACIYDNPVTRGLVNGAVSVIQASGAVMRPPTKKEELVLWKLAERNNKYIRVAGLIGASAVVLGAYGAHAFNKKVQNEELKIAFETANRYHFLHTFPLLALPLLKRPHLVGALLISGMSIFCGSCYIYAFTGNQTARQFTPYGGTLLICAWLSMVL